MDARPYHPGDPLPGTKYIVDRAIGRGAHGAVYLVHNRDLEGKPFVVKVMHVNLAGRRDVAARMRREARLLARIQHPNVVEILDAGVTEDDQPRPYFVMEHLRGGDLRSFLQSAPKGISLQRTLTLGAELCDALGYVHTTHGIIHRDVKPANIYLHQPYEGRPPVTKLLDFGVVYTFAIEDETIRTAGGVPLGTPKYMAPEQLQGERPTPQADIYALGAVLYECLTGQAIFPKARTLGEAAEARMYGKPARLSSLVLDVPRALDALVHSMLAREATARPRSMAEIATELREISRTARPRTSAPPPTAMATPRKGDSALDELLTGLLRNPSSKPPAQATDSVTRDLAAELLTAPIETPLREVPPRRPPRGPEDSEVWLAPLVKTAVDAERTVASPPPSEAEESGDAFATVPGAPPSDDA